MDKDVAACEAKLGKEPELPPEKNDESVTLSESITERLQSDKVNEDRLNNYDNYWIKKLACIDESHSMRNNLDIAEAEETLKSIAEYAQSGKKGEPHSQPTSETDRLKDCFELSRGETLKCSENVERFIEEVDRLMYEAIRKDSSGASPQSDKKLTYAERFGHDLRF